MKALYVNPNFVANGNETEKYINMIKREKAYAAYQKEMQEARKPKKKKIAGAVILTAAVAGACAAAYKAIDDLKNGKGYSEIPVPRTEVADAKPEIIIEASQVVEKAAEPEIVTV